VTGAADLEHAGGELKGRIGGRVDGKDVRLSSEAPPGVAALAAVLAFRLLGEEAAGTD
jgi:hypothetical protein